MASTMVAVDKQPAGSQKQPDQETTARFPSSTRLLRSLNEHEAEILCSAGWSYRASRGQIIYCEGELLRFVYLVQTGSVKLVRNSEDGKELIVGLVGPGQSFGALVHPLPAPSLAQPLEESVLYGIPIQAVQRMAAAKPAFALDLLLIRQEQWLSAEAAAARLAFENVPQRLASLLLTQCSERYGTLNVPINQTEIANLIGSSRETVCSILNRLRREGILSIVKGKIRILDRARLARMK